ncbi:MAG: GspH/FimT family pseudopilin [Gammaproteobacteria bacterium]
MGKIHAEGVTLVELMITLAVLAVVLTIGIPAFGGFLQNNRMSAAANDVLSSLHLARSEALKRQVPVVVCASTTADAANPTCDGGAGFDQGWVVFADTNNDAQVNGGDVVIAANGPLHPAIGANSTWGTAGAPVYVAFGANGSRQDQILAATPSVINMELCDERGDIEISGGVAAGRWLRISATGHPRVFSERALVQGLDNPLGGC